MKTIEGKQHPDRDAQFRYLNDQVRRFVRRRDPVVSVDTKKKELVGYFENRGLRWQPAGQPKAVNVHDFPIPGRGKASPYGTYDVMRDEAVVNVGITHETAEFAVESIRRWVAFARRKGLPTGPEAVDLCGCRGQQRLAVARLESPSAIAGGSAGMAVTVCHYPPGTSKWNKVEHRLFFPHQYELARPPASQL